MPVPDDEKALVVPWEKLPSITLREALIDRVNEFLFEEIWGGCAEYEDHQEAEYEARRAFADRIGALLARMAEEAGSDERGDVRKRGAKP